MTIAQLLIDYIATSLLGGDAEGLDEDVPLLELNIIDSSAIFDIVDHLQRTFRITVPMTRITPENFRTVTAIAALVESLQQEGAGVR
ncbi:MAG TPA: acyl carrier protein [Actinospica sp.]|jgi:acyl carrier protein|nr:acyl carrier protein [Actinospica sp.]